MGNPARPGLTECGDLRFSQLAWQERERSSWLLCDERRCPSNRRARADILATRQPGDLEEVI
jgi:hypothetical protein